MILQFCVNEILTLRCGWSVDLGAWSAYLITAPLLTIFE